MFKKSFLITIAVVMLNLAPDAMACTTFLISGKYTPDGKPILFKNRDTDQMQNSLAFFEDGKYKYIGLVDGTEEWKNMVWGGYNETGFAIINSAAYNNNIGDTSSFKDQEGVIMKLALQTCETLADFEILLARLPKPMGLDANFGVIDAFGGAAYYETGNYDFTKFDANNPEIAPQGFLVRTNHSTRANPQDGFGFVRYNTALEALNKALTAGKVTPQFLFSIVSRNLKHSLTHTDLRQNLPIESGFPDFRFFIDYIPRESTASAIMIVGAKNREQANNAMMWTILGFPLTSVAIPTWISVGAELPVAVKMDRKYQSPLCVAALKLKSECFPIIWDRGWNYINLSVLINEKNDGYMQLIEPIENIVFEKAGNLIAGLDTGTKSRADIKAFYNWVDQYLEEKYKTQLGITLFKTWNE